MKPRNVGPREATARVAVAAIIVGVALSYAYMRMDPVGAATFGVAVLVASLLLKSAVQRSCPIHEHVDIDTTPDAGPER